MPRWTAFLRIGKRKICLLYTSTYLYVPKADNMARMVRDAKIRKEYNGHNYRRLAVKYGLSEISVRNIVENEKGRPIPGQMTMFDMAK